MRRALLALLVAALLAVAAPAAPAGAATPGTLAGTVTRSGAPLAGAPVWVFRADAQVQVAATTTAADGTWSRPLAPGAYRVLVWAGAAGLPATWYPGSPLWADAGIVHVGSGATTTLHQGVGEPATLRGLVTSGGQPLAGVTVHAWWSGVRLRSTTTATDGTYVIADLVPGTYVVSATDPTGAHDARYHPASRDAAQATRVVAAPGVVTGGVDVALQAAGAITGRVTSPDGTPVAGLPVSALDVYGVAVQRTATAADGTYAMAGLPGGSYRVLVWPSGPWAGAYAPDAQDFEGGAPQPVVAGTTRAGVDVVVATTADHPVPPYQGNAGAPKVALIGDSITRNSTSLHHARLDPDWWVSSLGIGGRRTDEMTAVADRFAATDPDQVVLNLGSNDAHQGVAAATVVANLEALVDRFPAADCVHLVTVTTSTGNPTAAARARQVNDGIRALAASRPQVRVVDWADALATNLATGGPTWSLDNLHPVGAGRQALATLLAEALAGCPTPDGRVTGVVREDVDGDGVAAAGEPGQGGVLVRAWRDGDGDGEPEALVATTTTAADGTYELAGLAPDDYRVALDAGQVAPAVGSPGQLDVAVTAGGTATADLGLGLPAAGRDHAAATFPATEVAMLRDVQVLPSGEVVVAGRFDEDLRLGSGAQAATLSGAGGIDGFVAVLDPSGQPRWARRIASPTDDDVLSVAVGPGGEVAVAGTLGSTGTVGEGAGTTGPVPAARDAFAAVLEADGTLRWIRTASGIGLSLGTSVAFTPDGHVVAGAAFIDRVDVGDGLHLDGAGPVDSAIVVRDGGTGRALRAVQLTGPGFELATGLSPTPDGRVVVTGLAGAGSELRGGGTTVALTGVAAIDALVAVVDPAAGVPVAGRLVGSSGADRALRSTVDPTTGDVYVVADLAGPATVDGQVVASAPAGAVLALDPALGLRWAVAAHAPSTTMVDVAVHDGAVVAVGAFEGRLEVGGQVRHAAHGEDGLLVELDTDGALLDVDVLAGAWGDDLLMAADHDVDGGIVAVGAFAVQATVGRGPGSASVTAEGTQDGLLVRLAP